jgi:hypothetical protein
VHARARADVHDVARGAHDVEIVLDDDDGVALIPQPLERRDEPRGVAGMKAERGLVEHVEHAHERAAEARAESDALRLAGAQRRRRAAEREVADTDLVEEAQARVDLPEERRADLALALAPCGRAAIGIAKQRCELRHGERREIGDGAIEHAHRERLLAETLAVAHGTDDAVFVAVELKLVVVARRRCLGARTRRLRGRGPPARAPRSGGGLARRCLLRRSLLRRCLRAGRLRGRRPLASGPAPRGGVLLGRTHRRRAIGRSAFERDRAEALASRTRALGRVPREGARRDRGKRAVAARADRALREQLVGLSLDREADEATARLHGELDGVREACAHVGLDREPIHDDVELVRGARVDLDALAEVARLAVEHDTDEALLAQARELGRHVADLAAHDRRTDDDTRTERSLGPIDDLLHRVRAHLAAAARAVRPADAREEHAQEVVHLGDGAHRRARAPVRGLLPHGDRGREPLDRVDVGAREDLEVLACVRAQRLDVATLALGVERVEDERALARAARPGDDADLAARERDVDVLEVVLARTADADHVAPPRRRRASVTAAIIPSASMRPVRAASNATP